MHIFVVLLALVMIHSIETTPDRNFGCAHRNPPCSTNTFGNFYKLRPECKPHNLIGDKVVPCERLGKSVPVGGGLYSSWELHFNVIMSPLYAAKMADSLGYDKCCPGKNTTFLEGMNLVTPWSGVHGGIAIDGIFGFDRTILRRCEFPTEKFPFLCTGSAGTPGTQGEDLGTLSYISLLHDERHHRWTLFGQCWNAKTPNNPNAIPTATSFNVFSLDSSLPPADRRAIISKLRKIGFRTDNFIEPDFTGNPGPVEC